MFKTARIKLTLWYLLIILAISLSLSGLVYLRVSQVIRLEYERIERRLQRDDRFMGRFQENRPPGPLLTPEDLMVIKRKLILQLVLINTGIGSFVVIAGYFLSGQTLKPISKAMQQQKQFIADASHELRTPITALKTTIEVELMDKKLPSETKNLLKDHLEDVRGLEHLSESLLKLARADEASELSLEAVSVTKVFKDVEKLAKPLVNAKEITLAVKQPESLVKVWGDEAAIIELLMIAVDNAIKYSPEKSRISLKSRLKKKQVQIIISDHGPGIPEKDLPFIFDRFYRADSSRNKSEKKGYGLGLSIAKRLAQQVNGSIQLDSQVGVGTKVIITLARF